MFFDLTWESIIIIGGFIIFVFLFYKLFRIIMKGTIIAGAGFSFPWLIKYLELPINIVANIETGLEFAMAALGIFLIYEFLHFIKYFFKILSWPFKLLVKKR